MRIKLPLGWILLSIFGALVLHGAAAIPVTDPLWQKAVDFALRSKDMVASRIVTRTDIFNGSGERLESVKEVEKITGWQGDKPVVTSEKQKEVFKKAGISVKLTIGATDNPFYASQDGLVTYLRKGNEIVDGRECVAFSFENVPGPNDKVDYGTLVGTAWVEKASGIPIKAEYRPKRLPSKVSSYLMTLHFHVLPDGYVVPREARMEMKGGILFIKRVVKLEKSFYDWTKTPARQANEESSAVPKDRQVTSHSRVIIR